MAIKYTWIFLLFALFACNNAYDKTKTGLEYKFHIQNQGVQKPMIGEVLYLNYLVKNSEGQVLYSTAVQRKGEPDVLTLEFPKYNGDYFEALAMMSLGDSATFLINADSFYQIYLQSAMPENIKKGSKLMLDIRLLKILTAEQSEEIKNKEKFAKYTQEYEAIKSYVETNKLAITTTEEGIKYKIDSKGNPKIKEGDVVTVHYTGKLLNGQEFISTYAANQPQEIIVGQDYEIEFYNMILPLMGNKDKGMFIIPFVYAFQEKGVRDKVPPFSPVIYEFEIINVQKTK